MSFLHSVSPGSAWTQAQLNVSGELSGWPEALHRLTTAWRADRCDSCSIGVVAAAAGRRAAVIALTTARRPRRRGERRRRSPARAARRRRRRSSRARSRFRPARTLPIVLDTAVGSDTSRVEAAGAGAPVASGARARRDGACRRQPRQRRRDRRDAIGQGERTRARRDALRLARAARRRCSATRCARPRSAAPPKATKKKDALEIGAPAAGGAIDRRARRRQEGRARSAPAVGGGAGTASCSRRAARKCGSRKGAPITLQARRAAHDQDPFVARGVRPSADALPCCSVLPPADSAPPTADHARASRSGPRRVVALIEVLLCSDYPTQFALGGTLAALGYRAVRFSRQRCASAMSCALSFLDAALLVGLILLFLAAHGESPAPSSLRRPSGRS